MWMTFGVKHLVDIVHIKKVLSERFEMKDMKELHYFLGIEIIQTPDDIMISQRHYILNLLYKFGMTECKLVDTPLDRNLKLDANSCTEECELTYYWQLVGSLIYLTITPPHLSYSVDLIIQFMQTPKKIHLDFAKRVLRYVCGTIDYSVLYKSATPIRLKRYTDADKRSTSGFVFSLGSVAISWSNKK